MGSTADITAALAAVSDEDLRSLRAGLPHEESVAPQFIGWLEAAADWELGRRAGRHGAFPDLRCAPDEGEVDCGLVALAILHAAFDSETCLCRLLDVTAEALCAPLNATPRLAS